MAEPISNEYVRKVANLSRLALSDAEVDEYRGRLAAVIGYVERLRELDLTGIEPLTNVGDTFNRLRDDAPGPTLPNQTLMKMAPRSVPPFVVVPKVIGEGGGA
ncbi:MAG: Asp-tRNA(Asn)/Glu-tRNA(Gln) amidotransferase subunit GatC [Planctomycetes bacterium]|nr:Asp-tRNA(Asn)/Glu-tRNA(Gln) amidotransferase subunit GatC [Planctomycetota bacterium]